PAIGRSGGPKGPVPGSARSSSSSAGASFTPTSGPNRPMNMLPFTKPPRLPNIGLTSTPGASGTSDRKRALSASVGFGTCISIPPSPAALASSLPPVDRDRQGRSAAVLPGGRLRCYGNARVTERERAAGKGTTMTTAIGSGTKADPWGLKTPPGTSEYEMYPDDAGDPPAIICQVGGTQLKYDRRAIDDL